MLHNFCQSVIFVSPNYLEFFHLIYGRFLVIWPKYAPCHPTPWSRTNIRLCKRYIPVLKLFFFSLIFFWHCSKFSFYFRTWRKFHQRESGLNNRFCPRFFDQVGHETMYASGGNKHFFTKSCHRQTSKIMNNLLKHLKILIFKVIFQCWKLVESFQIKFSMKNIGLGDQLLIKNIFENFDF